MNELMREEILDQPEALRLSVTRLREQSAQVMSTQPSWKRVIFTGSGDSYLAPLALEYAARHYLEPEVHVLPAQIAARYWSFKPGDLLVAISISGEAGRTVEAAKAARQANASVLAITVNEVSTLASLGNAALIIPFRSRSRQTPHTTDYLTTLLALATLIEAVSQHHLTLLDTLAEVTAQALQNLAAPCLEVAESIKQSDHFYFLGTGPSWGTAQYAAAKMWEVGGVVTFAFELEEFGHGPHMLINAAEPAFVMAPTGQSVDRARLMLEGLGVIGAKRVVITDKAELFPTISCLRVPHLPEVWSPFGTTLAVQWLCWAIATAKGYDVLTKDGVHPHPELYEQAHWQLVRDVKN